jgi:hypothetical protein
MSDDELATLAWGQDGRWSDQTKALMSRFNTSKLDLNLPWARTWTGWQCPSCKREKSEIARLSRSGVLRCKLESHHDHIEDYVRGIFDETNPFSVTDGAYNQQKIAAKNAVISLSTRFSRVLICSDCNSAESDAKKSVDGISRDFTFSPNEIAAFIKPTANRSHDFDSALARAIWEDRKADFEDRIDFARRMALRFANGRNRQEFYPPAGRAPFRDIYYFWSKILELDPTIRESSLENRINKRSTSYDGDGSFTIRKPKRQAKAPTDEEFQLIEQRLPAAGKEYWIGLGEHWICECCGRSKRGICRTSRRNQWTATIHKFQDWEEETNISSIEWRILSANTALIIGTHKPAYVCQDCRSITTKLQKLYPNIRADALTFRDLSSVILDVANNAEHEVDYELAYEIASSNQDRVIAVMDYEAHKDLSWDTKSRFNRRLKLGAAMEEAINMVSRELVGKGRIPSRHSAAHTQWLVDEGLRFEKIRNIEKTITAKGT